MHPKKRGVVMIVDDVVSEIDILVDVLGKDYEICVATDGESALELAAELSPDLILLDVLMPGIDGYEVCRRLKKDKKTRHIAIIFVTVLGEEGHEATGLALGALDYITKPFNVDIVKARVRNHMDLIEASRLKEEVNRIMHHDMRNALGMIVGFPDMILEEGNLSKTQKRLVEKIRSSGYTLLNMINLGILLYKMECGIYDFRPSMADAVPLLNRIHEDMAALEKSKSLCLQLRLAGAYPMPGQRFEIHCEDLLLYSMLSNLILNALEAAPPDTTVTVDLRKEDAVIIAIHNMGTVPESIRDRFFEKYVTAGKLKGTGLGTYAAKLIAEAHGGMIDMQSSENSGTTVTVRLPA